MKTGLKVCTSPGLRMPLEKHVLNLLLVGTTSQRTKPKALLSVSLCLYECFATRWTAFLNIIVIIPSIETDIFTYRINCKNISRRTSNQDSSPIYSTRSSFSALHWLEVKLTAEGQLWVQHPAPTPHNFTTIPPFIFYSATIFLRLMATFQPTKLY